MPHYPKTISWLRFPLAALIVLKHYYTPDISAEAVGGSDELMFYHYIGEFTQGVFPAIAVPLFFFISGISTSISWNSPERKATVSPYGRRRPKEGSSLC